jgi:hypothetical protein
MTTTKLTQKELVELVYSTIGTLSIDKKMSKKNIMMFVNNCSETNNPHWLAVKEKLQK